MTSAAPTIQPRARAGHRPELDQACAGCPQLGLLRALRRSGVAADGRLTCEPGDGMLLAAARQGEARLIVLAGPDEAALEELPGDLAAITRVERIDPGTLAEVEAAVLRALRTPGVTALVAVAPCLLGVVRGAPLAILPSRCNRCGGCLSLGCPALSDPGGEAVDIDPAVCAGCGLCAPLCRGRAIGPALTVKGH